MAAHDDVLYESDERIAIITLNRPTTLNALTPAAEYALRRAVGTALVDSAVRVILITGAGRGFCSGTDVNSMPEVQPHDWPPPSWRWPGQKLRGAESVGPELSTCYDGPFGYLLATPKPIIAAINGPAAGLGLVLSLYADLRFASASASFCTAFAKRGLVAEHGISWLLPRLVGPANALDLLLSARRIDALEALRMGLVNRVFAADTFIDDVRAYARGMVDTVSPRSVAVMKAQVWRALVQDFNDALHVTDIEIGKSLASADFKEGVAHFLEKRAPRFPDEY